MSSTAVAQAETQAALAAALAGGYLPTDLQGRAEQLQSRMEARFRISLLGMPRVGKTSVLNLLAGASIVPERCDLGTLQVVHGSIEQTTLTLPDGETATLDGFPTAETVAGLYPVLTRIEAPLPALRRISLLELGQTPDHKGQRLAVKWAIKQTDIMIWCTETFGAVERTLWELMPNRVRDHSILLRTRSDELGRKQENTATALRAQVGHDFAHVLAVSAQQACEASLGGVVDRDKMRASGGTKLISTILREIESGKQHAVDQADILLKKYPPPQTKGRHQDARGIEAPSQKPSVPEAPTPADATPTTPPDGADTPNPAIILDTYRAAVDRLQDVGRALVAEHAAASGAVLDASADALFWLGEHLDQAALPATQTTDHLRAMAQDAEDLVQLMRMEQTDEVGTDAVLVLLQLKRGFQAALAA
ncbi:MAG: hypothetical protein AAFQ58_16475 [Pseudomonadota bacterium]